MNCAIHRLQPKHVSSFSFQANWKNCLPLIVSHGCVASCLPKLWALCSAVTTGIEQIVLHGNGAL